MPTGCVTELGWGLHGAEAGCSRSLHLCGGALIRPKFAQGASCYEPANFCGYNNSSVESCMKSGLSEFVYLVAVGAFAGTARAPCLSSPAFTESRKVKPSRKTQTFQSSAVVLGDASNANGNQDDTDHGADHADECRCYCRRLISSLKAQGVRSRAGRTLRLYSPLLRGQVGDRTPCKFF